MTDLLWLLGECSIRVTVVAAGVALLMRILRLQSPTVRHTAWAAVVVFMLALPALVTVIPDAPLRVLPDEAATTQLIPSSLRLTAGPTSRPSVREAPESSGRHEDGVWQAWLAAIYLLGVLLCLARLVIGTLHTKRVIASGIRQAGYLMHRACSTPITAGWLRPVVIVPGDWSQWSPTERDLVLAHEAEHARRRDPLLQWVALLNRAVFWFHPLAWWLERHLAELAEDACDAAVLASGHDRADYADCLIRLARSVDTIGARVRPLDAGVRGGDLPGRIHRILHGARVRQASRSRLAGAVAAGAVLAALGTAAVPVQAGPALTLLTSADIGTYFGDLPGTFVLLDGQTGQTVRYNGERAAARFSPCSTFKVAYAAMFLESGVAPDPELVLAYDPSLNEPAPWASDQSLRSALKLSATWYFDALAQRLGNNEVRRFVRQFDYGNVDAAAIDDGRPRFWWDGALRISADEQIAFLQRFYAGDLGLSERTTRLTKEIMLADSARGWRLSAKTGACQPEGDGEATNWYVGFVERGSAVYYFALELGGRDLERGMSARIPIARAILSALGVLG